MSNDFNRYIRQIALPDFGVESQKKLRKSHAVIIGAGALGTVSAECLARAGVGKITLIDRDYVELTNLQQQTIYTEEDAANRTPKAIAAANHLQKVNSQIKIVSKILDITANNIEEIVADCDIIIDGTDNLDVRLLINEACTKHGRPWIYAGALGFAGVTMNVISGETACLRCMISDDKSTGENCATHGVLGMITGILALHQSAEAVKILTNSADLRKTLLSIDLRNNKIKQLEIEKDDDCAVCAHRNFEFLDKKNTGITAIKICSADLIQITPGAKIDINLEKFAVRLAKIGNVAQGEHTLHFKNNSTEFTLFADGRAMFKHAIDENHAKSLYAEFISG